MNEQISKTVSADDVVSSCFAALSCPLGEFYTDKDYGNSIKNSSDIGELLAAARQAVGSIDGVFIKKAEVKNNIIEFTLIINDEIRSVSVSIDKNL